jgi:hypothetical protein
MFVPLQTLLSGEQCPEWSREDLLAFTEPKLGYTRDSPGFLRFVDVLCGMNAIERKSFLQFTTGCSSLPPGISLFIPLETRFQAVSRICIRDSRSCARWIREMAVIRR